MAEPVCVVPAGDWTGEGAVWHAEEEALYWVDITRFLIHRYDPATKATWSWFFSEPPTALGLDRPAGHPARRHRRKGDPLAAGERRPRRFRQPREELAPCPPE